MNAEKREGFYSPYCRQVLPLQVLMDISECVTCWHRWMQVGSYIWILLKIMVKLCRSWYLLPTAKQSSRDTEFTFILSNQFCSFRTISIPVSALLFFFGSYYSYLYVSDYFEVLSHLPELYLVYWASSLTEPFVSPHTGCWGRLWWETVNNLSSFLPLTCFYILMCNGKLWPVFLSEWDWQRNTK